MLVAMRRPKAYLTALVSGPEEVIAAAGQIPATSLSRACEALPAVERMIRRAADKGVRVLVLPECAYPAYYLGSADAYWQARREGQVFSSSEYLAWLAERAGRYRLYVATGYVEEAAEGLFNAAALLDPSGRIVARCRKTFLWDLEHEWFLSGDAIRVYSTPVGRVGMLICADARAPEVIATLVRDGAELILMPTAWVNVASSPQAFRNPQPEFLIPARAVEFGVPFVCANKVGREPPEMEYCGHSVIVRADGSVVAEASADEETLITAPIRPQRPRGVWMAAVRRNRLLTPSSADQTLAAAPSGGSGPITIGAVSTQAFEALFGGTLGDAFFRPLQAQGVRLLLVNLTREDQAEQLTMMGHGYDVHVVAFPTHTTVRQVGPARVGMLGGQAARSFASARALALDGAQVLCVFDAPTPVALLQARALENRVYVLAASRDSAVIIGPDGDVLDRVEGRPTICLATIDPSAADDKTVGRCTHIWEQRRPVLYRF